MIKWLPKIGMNGYFNQFWTPFSFYDTWYKHENNTLIPPNPVNRAEVDGFVRDQLQYIRREGMMYHAAGHGWTCGPFGLDSAGWYKYHDALPEGMQELLALINNRRALYDGIPLNTNLCYSNPVVKEKLVNAITKYCLEHPDVEYLHFWLADAMNNQCECPACQKRRPADHYVDILNLLDERLTAAGITAHIVPLPDILRLNVDPAGKQNQESGSLCFSCSLRYPAPIHLRMPTLRSKIRIRFCPLCTTS